MLSANPFVRFQRLPGTRRRLLLWALWTLAGASAATAFMPFRRAIRFGSIPIGQRGSLSPDDIVWAVEASARRLPWRTVCLQKGLAVQRMMRAAAMDATLHYGARHDPDSRDLEAHVWVMLGGCAVIGGDEARSFATVATFP